MTIRPSFGDVIGEYVALREGCAVVTDLYDLVWVSGPDATRFLDGLLSQDIASLRAGATTRALLLTPQGKLRAWLVVFVAANDRIGLLADVGRGSIVVEDLTRFKIRVDAEIAIETRPVVGLHGPLAPAVLEEAALDVADVIDGRPDGAFALRLPGGDPAGYLVVGADVALLEASGAKRAGRVAVDTVRIENGCPVVGIDIDESTIPQEADIVEGAVSFTKGCYLGQELVARIDSRGHVNRHLRALTVKDAVIPPVGAEVVAGDKVVGVLTTVGESPALRAPVAMALIRREVEPDALVSIKWDGGSAEATVVAVPIGVPSVRDPDRLS